MQDNVMFFSDKEYDVHSLYRLIFMNSELGTIRVHDAEGGYLLTFRDCPKSPQESMRLFQKYLDDLINNKWSH